MINSITFDCSGERNYILDKQYKSILKKGKTKKGYEKAIKDYESRKIGDFSHSHRYFSKGEIWNDFYEEVEDGYKNPQLVKNLQNTTFTFDKNRINIIFGPNASGKTTILKAIAANTLCGDDFNLDGFTNPEKYNMIDLNPNLFEKKLKPYDDNYVLVSQKDYDAMMHNLIKSINKEAGNGIKLDWDGSIVYYENFANRRITGSTEDFVGTIMGSFGDALTFNMMSKSLSLGQRNMHLFNQIGKIINQCNNGLTTGKLIDAANNKNFRDKDLFANKQIQVDYLNQFYNKQACPNIPTFLFDEIDKSFDILNIISLYKNILPDILHNNDIQIIMISHNPIILSSLLDKNDYNIISIDNDYTNAVRTQLKEYSF